MLFPQQKSNLDKFVSGIIACIFVLTTILTINLATISAQQNNLHSSLQQASVSRSTAAREAGRLFRNDQEIRSLQL